MVKLGIFLLAAMFLEGCASNPASSDSWKRYTVSLSGKTISFASPRGHFRDKYTPYVDLSTDQREYITLFSASWVFSGLLADKGGLDFGLGLSRAPVGEGDEGLLRGVQESFSKAYAKLSPQGVKLTGVEKRPIGGRQWLCFSVPEVGTGGCALKVDSDHYLMLRLSAVDNSDHQISIKARDELAAKIERSVEVAF